MITRVLIITIVILLLEFYFYQAVKKLSLKFKLSKQKKIKFAYWGFTSLLFLWLIIALVFPVKEWPKVLRIYGTSFILIVSLSKLFGVIPLLIDDLIRFWKLAFILFRKKNSKDQVDTNIQNKISRQKFLSQVALGISSFFFLNFIWGMLKTAFDYKTHKIKIKIPNLPNSFKGLRIVQFSDAHLGSFINTHPVETAVDIINKLQPDIIFFTGDLVNDVADEAEPHIHALRKLSAPMGVYSILGNHDYGDYVRWLSDEAKNTNMEKLYGIYRELGWNLLLNENRVLQKNEESIALIGVENWGALGSFTKYGNLDKAVLGVENIEAKILLSHDPSHWSHVVTKDFKDIALTLSGHTHGMQFGIEIPGIKWSPSKYFYPQWAGLYENGNQQIYVNRGLGFLGYAGRVGIKPEITLIELE